MAAFMVFYAKITEPERFSKYIVAVQPLIQRHGGSVLARGAPPTVIEGEWPWHAAAIFEFPGITEANSFWDSPEYAEIAKLREGAAIFQGILLENSPPVQ